MIRFSPPDSDRMGRHEYSSTPHVCNVECAASKAIRRGIPRKTANSRSASAGVMSGKGNSCCGTYAQTLADSVDAPTHLPKISIDPLSGSNVPTIWRSSVVLPAPFGPRMQPNSPRASVKLTLSFFGGPAPNSFVTPLTDRASELSLDAYSLLNSGKHQRAVLSTESEVTLDCVGDLEWLRNVAHDVDVALRIWIVEIDGRGYGVCSQGLNEGNTLNDAACPRCVTDDTLWCGDGRPLAEDLAERSRLRCIIKRRRRSVGADQIHLGRMHAGH